MSRRPRSTRDAPLRAWFASRGWQPAAFQREAWARWLRGESGLIVTPTGSGKTLAAIGGPLIAGLAAAPAPRPRRGQARAPRLQVLWITPLRALAADTRSSLRDHLAGLGLDWEVALRTGDAGSRDRRLARHGLSEILVTTPESLALQLTYADSAQVFAGLHTVIVDEWHELLGNKRGVLLQLGLARLRAGLPELRIWGLSATLGNLEQALAVLLPHQPPSAIVRNAPPRPMTVETLLPQEDTRFPWAGNLGMGQLQQVAARIQRAGTSLLFTNTRAQAELWHRALSAVWLEDPASLALHHGSLNGGLRAQVEQGLRQGTVRCVVTTSSLDLGVDFPAVDQVLQLGSPKGLARLLQRAGRARHRPGEPGHVVGVPTHGLEVLEYAAVRQALAAGQIESRTPPTLCLDVLAQHLVSIALGGGFQADAMLAEVRGTHAFAALAERDWHDVLDFIVQGGAALSHYPDFHRVVLDAGTYRVTDRRVALRQRLSVGTISSDGAVLVKVLRGGTLGAVEEAFAGRLKPGDTFQFAGRTLELVRLHEMTAWVRPTGPGKGVVPRWQGGQLSLSTALGGQMQRLLAGQGVPGPEREAAAGLLATQAQLSACPPVGALLVEIHRTRDGHHLCLFPFAGRAAHEGLATLLAWRMAQWQPLTVSFTANDYGLMLTTPQALVITEEALRTWLAPDQLRADLQAAVNLGELARRQFRSIARIAGLLPPNRPGQQPRGMRQLQASAGLLHDVLRQHDPGHVLLRQADEEVLQALNLPVLQALLQWLGDARLLQQAPRRLTPLAFPLWAERLRGQLSSEDWKSRVARAARKLEEAT